jgi:hypothetical protein
MVEHGEPAIDRETSLDAVFAPRFDRLEVLVREASRYKVKRQSNVAALLYECIFCGFTGGVAATW